MTFVYPDSFKVEIKTNGSFTDVTTDVLSNVALTTDTGIRGEGILDLVAVPGTMKLLLNNNEYNSATELGYYSPDNASVLSGFEIGKQIRFKVTYDSVENVLFTGHIKGITPLPFEKRERRTEVTAKDWLDKASRQATVTTAVQLNKRADQIIDTVTTGLSIQPESTDYATGQDTFPYSLDSETDEKTSALRIYQKVAQSTGFGLIYLEKAGQFTFIDRLSRFNPDTGSGDVDAFFDEAGGTAWGAIESICMEDLRPVRDENRIVNDMKQTTHPAEVEDTSGTASVLYTHQKNESLVPGQSITFNARYVDPNQKAQRVSGQSMVTPVKGTDYIFDDDEGSLNGDLNDDLGVTVTFGGNSAEVTLTNNGSSGGFVNLFQLRGFGIYNYEPTEYLAEDATSQTTYGENSMVFDMPYQDDINVASSIGDYLINQYKDPQTTLRALTFLANQSDTAMDAAMALDVNSFVRVDETVIGFSSKFFYVQSIGYRMIEGDNGTLLYCTLGLKEADLTDYFVLDTSELDGADILAPG